MRLKFLKDSSITYRGPYMPDQSNGYVRRSMELATRVYHSNIVKPALKTVETAFSSEVYGAGCWDGLDLPLRVSPREAVLERIRFYGRLRGMSLEGVHSFVVEAIDIEMVEVGVDLMSFTLSLNFRIRLSDTVVWPSCLLVRFFVFPNEYRLIEREFERPPNPSFPLTADLAGMGCSVSNYIILVVTALLQLEDRVYDQNGIGRGWPYYPYFPPQPTVGNTPGCKVP